MSWTTRRGHRTEIPKISDLTCRCVSTASTWAKRRWRPRGWERSVRTNRFPVRGGRKSQPAFKRRQGWAGQETTNASNWKKSQKGLDGIDLITGTTGRRRRRRRRRLPETGGGCGDDDPAERSVDFGPPPASRHQRANGSTRGESGRGIGRGVT